MQIENEDVKLTIQSIQAKKALRFLMSLTTELPTDTIFVEVSKEILPAIANLFKIKNDVSLDDYQENIYSKFVENYELALKYNEEKYRAELQAKDEEIKRYRQEVEHLRKLAKVLASQPIVINSATSQEPRNEK